MPRVVPVFLLAVAVAVPGAAVPVLASAAPAPASAAAAAEVARADFDADGAGDLVVGMPGENVDKLRDAGAVGYHHGPLGGPDDEESRPLHADSLGVPGAAEPGDRFGSVLGPGPLGG